MIHGYHVIWGAYGFWLPNDPAVHGPISSGRGVCAHSAGRPARSIDATLTRAMGGVAGRRRQSPSVSAGPTQRPASKRWAAVSPPVPHKSHLTIWACSILPEHVHLVIARHTYKVEQVCNLLKGEATKQLKAESLHPQQRFRAATANSRRCGPRANGRCIWTAKRPWRSPSATSRRTRSRKASRRRRGPL